MKKNLSMRNIVKEFIDNNSYILIKCFVGLFQVTNLMHTSFVL